MILGMRKLNFKRNEFMGGAGESGEPAAADPNVSPGNTPQYTFPDGVTDPEVLNAAEGAFKNFWKDGQLDMSNLLKSYVNTQKMIGMDKMTVPNENTSEEQWRETFHKIGLPEDFGEYKVENNLQEGMAANEEMFEGFKKVAYEAGILPKQSQAVIDFFNSAVAQSMQAQEQRAAADVQDGIEKMKLEWGSAFDRKVAAAKYGFDQFVSDPEDVKHLAEKGFFNDPVITKMMANIGESLKEDVFPDNAKTDSSELTPDEIQAELQAMYKSDHPFMNKSNPDHKRAQDRFMKLMAMKVGNRPAGQTFSVSAG